MLQDMASVQASQVQLLGKGLMPGAVMLQLLWCAAVCCLVWMLVHIAATAAAVPAAAAAPMAIPLRQVPAALYAALPAWL